MVRGGSVQVFFTHPVGAVGGAGHGEEADERGFGCAEDDGAQAEDAESGLGGGVADVDAVVLVCRTF